MNRGHRVIQAILLVVCVIVTLQGISAEETPCEHEFTEIEIPGDCLNPGMRYKECIKCGEQIDFENTPALGHDFGAWMTDVPAKCNEKGKQSRVCQNCGHQEERTIAAAGHQYVQEVSDPTCTKGGKVYLVCKSCGDRSLQEELPALGHDFDEGVVTKEPTDRAMGRRTFTCQRCGLTRTENIPRLEKPGEETADGSGNDSHNSAQTDSSHSTKKPNSKKKYSSKKRYSKKTKGNTDNDLNALRWAKETGIYAGFEDVSPDTACTRGETLMLLWRAAGSPEPTETISTFSDVSSDDTCYKAVMWAVENGITSGMDADHFGPEEECTRAQAMTFLYKAQGSPACEARERFKDVDREDYFYQPVIWAIQNKFTSGVCRYYFGSFLDCTFGQLAVFLHGVYG